MPSARQGRPPWFLSIASDASAFSSSKTSPASQLALTDRLTAEGYTVETAGDGDTAITRATGEPFDVIVLDVMLPGRDGFDVAKTIRQQGIATPILMLTARSQVVDRVVGLKLGADDYLTKPFETIELLARIEALLRRAPSAPSASRSSAISFGDITVDVRKAEVTRERRGRSTCPRKEFQLLRYFIEHRGATHLARRTAARSVGLQRDAVDAHGRRARRVAAAEARTQPARAAVHPHGARDGLQVRWAIVRRVAYAPRGLGGGDKPLERVTRPPKTRSSSAR